MKRYIKHHPWNVIEDGFVPSNNRISESIFSLGNGRFGTRGNFEEDYSGDSLQGSYVAGIYYPDPTRVGWWKNGYPEYFAKVLNATNWIGIRVSIEEEILDIAKCTVIEFQRDLDMQTGLLNRTVQLRTEAGRELRIVAKRFCSMDNDELSIQSYSICPLNFEGEIKLLPFLDGDVVNEDSNYDVKFWEEIGKYKEGNCAILQTKTRKLDFVLTCGMVNQIYVNNDRQDMSFTYKEQDKFIGQSYSINVRSNDVLEIQKVCCIVSSENYALSEAKEHVLKTLKFSDSFQEFFERHADKWKEKWSFSDISIKGDIAAQQGIRFNIFQLFQTYTGADSRLNIGPKGFTGEKYGGCTYWDTEAYCINFYLSSAPQEVARNLLVYRHKQLGKAIENAEKLGFHSGAALFPMVTMNGEECHNEWEITFEEIHRNGAIAYAIYRYVNYTNDKLYLVQYGLEVLI
ncbi:MAG: glycoside hydrolase family 65 protein, partial [Bacteroidota bacterium]